MATTETGGGNGVTGARADNTIFTNEYSSNPSIANITDVGQRKWGGAVGTGVTLTYSFNLGNGNSIYSASYPSDAGAATAYGLNAIQQNAALQAMNLWAGVSNINFAEMQDSNLFLLPEAGDIRWANSMVPPTALGYYPSLGGASGDIWFGTGQDGKNQNPVSGGYGFATFVHELGHALGLNHPHEGNTPAVAGEDQLKYSIMSYRDFAGDSIDGYDTVFYPTTPMLNDILAIQWMYGANWNYNNGNNLYFFNAASSVYQTIWDGGGVDTLSAFNQTEGCEIDLHSGQWSKIGVAFDNGSGTLVRDCLTIAYGTVIENADGSGFNDRLVGNSVDNVLNGLAGNDWLEGQGGSDILSGGQGNDSYVISDSDTIVENADEGTDTVRAAIDYTLGDHLENLVLTSPGNINGTGNSLSNYMEGSSGINTLAGLDGNDTYLAGIGDESDVLWENPNEGTDSVEAYFDFTLGENFENLQLFGAADTGTGNGLNNTILGNNLANVLSGLDGDDLLDGGGGADLLFGGNGNDRLRGGADIDNTLFGGEGDDVLEGVAAGVSGGNVLLGGVGNDTYILNSEDQDIINEVSGTLEGVDTVVVFYSYDLNGQSSIENITLTTDPWGHDAAIDATGNEYNNVLRGNSAANFIMGGAGFDILIGNGGDDNYVVDADDILFEDAGGGIDSITAYIDYILPSNFEDLFLIGNADATGTGNELNNSLFGYGGNNTLRGGAGNDLLQDVDLSNDFLDGGTGADTMTGGGGNDIYVVDDLGDMVLEGADKGTDSVRSSIDYALTANVENLTLQGPLDIDATGNDLANNLTGNSGDNTLTGGAGDDILNGDGNTLAPLANTLLGGMELLAGDAGVSAILTHDDDTSAALDLGTAVITVAGQSFTGNNQLYISSNGLLSFGAAYSQSFNTNLQAGTEPAFMLAALWDDWVTNRDAQDQVLVKLSDDNSDGIQDHLQVQWDVHHYSAGNNLVSFQVEIANGQVKYHYFNLDTGAIGTANGVSTTVGLKAPETTELLAFNQLVSGWGTFRWAAGAGSDILDGGAGNDSMHGGSGDDVYIVDSAGDTLTENEGEGTDLVESSITRTLGANLENLTLTGSGNINGTGNSLDNVLTGNSGNNVLKGYVGTDTMVGGLGNDSYYLDSVDDVVTELSGEGSDTVFTKSDFILSADVENLTLLEAFPANNGTGNSGGNTLTGNSLANILDGNGGQDTLAGKKGDDTYRVDSLDDKVTEVSGEGTDTIESSVSWTLGANVENLTLTGSGNLGGTGNTLNNVLTGNSGNNVLKGYGGVDTLIGGLGNDQYYLDSADDVVTELAGGGTDYVYAKSSYALSDNVDRLYLLDGYATALNGTGNAGANVLTGNAYGNVLRGNGGNDILYGKGGSDTYEFGRGDGKDSITDGDPALTDTDVLAFLAGINHDQLWFSNVGSDLVVSVVGTTDKVTVKNWATGPANHVEEFRTTEGAQNLLLSGNVAALVTAMSGFTPPPLGTTSLSSPAYDPVLTAIAAAWS